MTILVGVIEVIGLIVEITHIVSKYHPTTDIFHILQRWQNSCLIYFLASLQDFLLSLYSDTHAKAAADAIILSAIEVFVMLFFVSYFAVLLSTGSL